MSVFAEIFGGARMAMSKAPADPFQSAIDALTSSRDLREYRDSLSGAGSRSPVGGCEYRFILVFSNFVRHIIRDRCDGFPTVGMFLSMVVEFRRQAYKSAFDSTFVVLGSQGVSLVPTASRDAVSLSDLVRFFGGKMTDYEKHGSVLPNLSLHTKFVSQPGVDLLERRCGVCKLNNLCSAALISDRMSCLGLISAGPSGLNAPFNYSHVGVESPKHRTISGFDFESVVVGNTIAKRSCGAPVEAFRSCVAAAGVAPALVDSIPIKAGAASEDEDEGEIFPFVDSLESEIRDELGKVLHRAVLASDLVAVKEACDRDNPLVVRNGFLSVIFDEEISRSLVAGYRDEGGGMGIDCGCYSDYGCQSLVTDYYVGPFRAAFVNWAASVCGVDVRALHLIHQPCLFSGNGETVNIVLEPFWGFDAVFDFTPLLKDLVSSRWGQSIKIP